MSGFIVGQKQINNMGISYASYTLNPNPSPDDLCTQVTSPSNLDPHVNTSATIQSSDLKNLLTNLKTDPAITTAYMVAENPHYACSTLIKNVKSPVRAVKLRYIDPENSKALAQVEEHCHREQITEPQKALLLKFDKRKLYGTSIEHKPGTLKESRLRKYNLDFTQADGQITQLKQLIGKLGQDMSQVTSDFGTLVTNPTEFIRTLIAPLIEVIKKNIGQADKATDYQALMKFLDDVIAGEGAKSIDRNDGLLSTDIRSMELGTLFTLQSNLAKKLSAFIAALVGNELSRFAELIKGKGDEIKKIIINPLNNSIFSPVAIQDRLRSCFEPVTLIMEDRDLRKKAERASAYISEWDNYSDNSFFKNKNGGLITAVLHQKDLLNSKA